MNNKSNIDYYLLKVLSEIINRLELRSLTTVMIKTIEPMYLKTLQNISYQMIIYYLTQWRFDHMHIDISTKWGKSRSLLKFT